MKEGCTLALGWLQLRVPCVVTSFLAILVGFMACSPPVVRAEPNNSEAVIDCSRFATGMYLCDAIDACNRNHKLPRWRMDIAHRFVGKALKCDLFFRERGFEEKYRPVYERCLARASRRAYGMNKRQVKFLDRRHNNFRKAQFYAFCSELDFQAEFLEDTYGLGYAVDQQICDTLGLPFYQEEDLINYAQCGDTLTTRLHAQLMGIIEPRARELLEDAVPEPGTTEPGDVGWCAVFPEERSDPVVCNLGFPPRPAIDPEATPISGGRNIWNCQNQFYRRARTMHGQHFDLLEHCTEDHMYCEIKYAHGDMTLQAYQDCIDSANIHCQKLRETTDSHVPRDIGLIKKACADVLWEDMIGMLGFGDVAADCGATNVNDLVDCVTDQVKCLAWNVANYVEARLREPAPMSFFDGYPELCDP